MCVSFPGQRSTSIAAETSDDILTNEKLSCCESHEARQHNANQIRRVLLDNVSRRLLRSRKSDAANKERSVESAAIIKSEFANSEKRSRRCLVDLIARHYIVSCFAICIARALSRRVYKYTWLVYCWPYYKLHALIQDGGDASRARSRRVSRAAHRSKSSPTGIKPSRSKRCVQIARK